MKTTSTMAKAATGACALLALMMPGSEGLVVTETTIEMSEVIGMVRPWTILPTGMQGAGAPNARSMKFASCGDRLLVAWSAHDRFNTWTEATRSLNEEYRGHLSEFEIDPTSGTARLVSDTRVGECEDMGYVTATPNCDLVAVLCRRSENRGFMPGMTADFLDINNLYGESWGWDNPEGGVNEEDSIYLLEWSSYGGASGQTSRPPTAIVHVNKAINMGWAYGNWALSVDASKTTYMLDIKVSLGGHEGGRNYAITRSGWQWDRDLSRGWACGTGHVLANHLVYNAAEDAWARLCWTDLSAATPGGGYAQFVQVVKRGAAATPAVEITRPRPNEGAWRFAGGVGSIVSRGSRGFLSVGSGIDPCNNTAGTANNALRSVSVGIAKIPTQTAGCGSADDDTCQTNFWNTPLLDVDSNAFPHDFAALGSTGLGGISFANGQHLGPGGDNGNRYLVGYGSGAKSLGQCSHFHIMETDDQGRIFGEPQEVSPASAWGEIDPWVAMRETGCVAWAYTWWDDNNPNGYGPSGGAREPGDEGFHMHSKLHVTVVCPEDRGSATATAACTRNCDGFSPACVDYTDTAFCPGGLTHSPFASCKPPATCPIYGIESGPRSC